MEVTFETVLSHVQGTIKIPLSEYTADRVKHEIVEYVRRIDAVHGL
jgi:hypothetical protein